MPVIRTKYKLEKKKNINKKNNVIHTDVYNTSTWRKLRLQYLSENPLCEECKKHGKLTLAIDVHHMYEISNGSTTEERKIIGYDTQNLMAVCSECHHKIHNNVNHS